jgi:lysophospholipase L1-like esterase
MLAGGLAVEGWGYRSLYDDTVDAPTRAAFIAKLVAAYSALTVIWLAMGTNDYGLNTQNAANFETRYGALLDDLHAAYPAATIYAQTPIERVSEVANGSGNTLGDYRAAIANAQATRAGFCTLVNGTDVAFPQQPGDLDVDGIHPTTAGQAKYATAVRAILGI